MSDMTRMKYANIIAHAMMKKMLASFPIRVSVEDPDELELEKGMFIKKSSQIDMKALGGPILETETNETPFGDSMTDYNRNMFVWLQSESIVNGSVASATLTSKGLRLMEKRFLDTEY